MGQFARDKRHLRGIQILTQPGDEVRELRGILLARKIGGRPIRFTLMPDDPLQRTILERELNATKRIVVRKRFCIWILHSRRPQFERCSPDGAGDEPDPGVWRRLSHGLAEYETRTDSGRGFVKVHRIGGRHPLAVLVEHEDPRINLLALLVHLATPGHV